MQIEVCKIFTMQSFHPEIVLYQQADPFNDIV